MKSICKIVAYNKNKQKKNMNNLKRITKKINKKVCYI